MGTEPHCQHMRYTALALVAGTDTAPHASHKHNTTQHTHTHSGVGSHTQHARGSRFTPTFQRTTEAYAYSPPCSCDDGSSGRSSVGLVLNGWADDARPPPPPPAAAAGGVGAARRRRTS